MEHRFPKINYIGNKQKLSSWIIKNLPTLKNNTILDLFSGGSSVSYELKKNKYSVISNDALYASFVLSKAIIENSEIFIEPYYLIEANNYDLTDNELNKYLWLSNRLYFPHEIEEIAKLIEFSKTLDGYIKYMFLSLLRRAMIRKLPYSRMNITWENIVKLRDEEYSYKKYGRRRAYHNLTFSELMLNDLENYNQAIFNNGFDNIASQLDAKDALIKYKDIADLVYIDPPYPGTMNNYNEFYGIFDQIFNKQIQFTNLTNKNEFLFNFNDLLRICSNYYSYAMISLNTNVKPNYLEIIELLKQYGTISITEKKHNYQISGKANKNSNNEILIIITF
ncbi:DNA adenine methylase [Staphylococcus lugdunensis]|uniref:DNA adenine methylase n=1 Tax=Staphylococcus TaxID=1279 RepID=UPI0008A4AD6D|nr:MULTISPECIES: DNA adenine methylase [Staphylococcus]ARJ13151.1 DNA methyltransferase [Staphylococcus lugdunensis]MCH8665329.1 DNA adenine methylase [Staphylococcus lugdunensis]OFJ62698.1 DNA methyltransferase [Staphylococcus sp. HMSC077E11]OFM45195.1 DNA methyltransferase [Staphylococcus sp. HMSC077E12]OFR88534.1 DNA methyltransferase [Staphylococcus sp. HMSC059F04]